MKTALITGSTSGIGQAIARRLAKDNFLLIICGRRQQRLEELKNELSSTARVVMASFDVRYREEVEQALNPVLKDHDIDVLVNNAGNAHGFNFIQDGNMDDWDAMIDGNVKGLLYVSKLVVQGMVKRKSGHIINIGSIAGKEVYPKGNVYCASKFAVDAISQGMRLDLNEYGIRVSQISPGLVDTEFSEVRFKGDKERAAGVYAGMEALTAEDIADIAHFILFRPAHVNIADIVVFPTAQASSTIVNRHSER